MATLRTILHDLALVVLVTAGVLACLVLWKALGIESNINVALETVNQGCAPGPCGTLAAFTKVVTKAGDATVTTQIQEQAIGNQVSATMTALQTIPAHVNETMDGLTGTAQTASTSLQNITDGLTPVLDSTKSTVDDVGAAVGSVGTAAKGLLPLESDADEAVRGLFPLEANTATITGNLGATTTDFQTKFHVFLFPPPCKTFGCKLARTWPYIKGGAEMVEPLYWGQQVFENRVP
jgi:hypothetical protein